MFSYCGNNPVIRADEQGTVFFTVLGAAIGAGVGALDAWMMGGDMDAIMQGAKAGAWSGGIAGAGVDVGVLVVASVPRFLLRPMTKRMIKTITIGRNKSPRQPSEAPAAPVETQLPS